MKELQEAYSAIYGLPLYGSLAFCAVKLHSTVTSATEDETTESKTDCISRLSDRFNGPSSIFAKSGDIDIRIISAGKDDGDFCSIYVNGEDYCENQRGFNLVVVDPVSRKVQTASFDTHGVPEEADRMKDFISAIKKGSLVLGGVKDDGAKFLCDAGRECLTTQLGVVIPHADDGTRLSAVVEKLPPGKTKVLLTVCAKANAGKCAKVLVENGWDMHAQASHTENTPLHDAVYQKNIEVAQVLIDLGADLSMKNRWGETPENIAINKHGFASLDDMIMAEDTHIQSVMRFIGL